jgi:hypothetical protein
MEELIRPANALENKRKYATHLYANGGSSQRQLEWGLLVRRHHNT